MALFAWIAAEAALTNLGLTVRAQQITPNDVGRLYWPIFMPRVDVDSTKIAEIRTLDYRPAADRREWNTRGRLIPLKTPELAIAEMVPIESYFTIDEKEINDIQQSVNGNAALFREIVGARIPRRVDGLVDSNYRRLELDALSAWANGSISVRHPQGAEPAITVSLGYDTARYLDNTAWDALGANAWAKFIAFMENSLAFTGSIGGAVMSRTVFRAIQAAAPQGVMAMPLTAGQAVDLVRDTLGVADFRFVLIDDQHDVFDNGGIATTRTRSWPVGKVAALPAGLRVGSSYFAPVARAYDFLASAGNRVDIRGNSVFRDEAGMGRQFTAECQLNALGFPEEQNVYVADASATP